ncbi:MAG: 1,4-alpha-glucan branching protein GlgB [Proteobacteria bacterium]|nr:1,4-alpha-glucan branching protein GlgB [Pseudomonadota bacterium]MBU1686438.1 1,4-alpha-glucan branching protein GlgB [Pseudomonadota bacterium]
MSVEISQLIEKVLQSDLHDPFRVLGYHQIIDEPFKAVVRSFQPHAESMRLILGDQKLDMYKMREEGLFELVIPHQDDCAYLLEATYFNGVTHSFRDPYSFLPQLSEDDKFLFNRGTNYQIYNHLGAHPAIIDGVDGIMFRVWAPNARRVSVIGDFNVWDGRVHQMRVLDDSGIWELFIPGLIRGEVYKYEIRTQDLRILEKSDPYQLYSEVRPKSASVAWDLEGYEWDDDDWLERRGRENPYTSPMSIYEVHLGSWQRDPADPTRLLTFGELSETLIPYVKRMGFTHLELLPIMEHPLDESWGYQSTGYFSVTSRHGTPQEFMAFIDQCHRNDIGVILDWVPSHFPTDGHSLGRFDGTALYEHDDPRLGAHPEWGTLIFNYSRHEVTNFLIASALFWLERFHIDGLRVDAVAAMLYLDYGKTDGEWLPNKHGGKENIEAIEFIKHMNSIIYQRNPHALIIAEESTSFFGVSKPADQGGLGFGFKWNMGWMNDMLHYFGRDPLYRKFHHNALTFSLLYAFSENFILPLSHDEVVHGKRSLLSKMPGDKWQQFANLRLLFFFLWTHPGKKLLFMGSEFGQISEWYCKVSLDWHLIGQDVLHLQMQYFVTRLNKIYRNSPALWETDFSNDGFRWMDFKDVDNSIVAFARFGKDRGEHVVCLLNFTPNVFHDYRLGVPDKVNYREVFSTDVKDFGGSGINNLEEKVVFDEPFGEAQYHVKVSVPPLGGIILKPVR